LAVDIPVIDHQLQLYLFEADRIASSLANGGSKDEVLQILDAALEAAAIYCRGKEELLDLYSYSSRALFCGHDVQLLADIAQAINDFRAAAAPAGWIHAATRARELMTSRALEGDMHFRRFLRTL
jgi:hypothetical protein